MLSDGQDGILRRICDYMGRLKQFFKTAGVYFVGNVFTKLISFFLLPLYTSRIDPVSFGSYNLIISVLNVAIPIGFLSIWDSVFRFSFDFQKEEDKYKVFNAGFVIVIWGALIFVVGTFVTKLFFNFQFPVLVCGYGIMTGLQYYYTVIARSLKDNVLFVVSGCLNSAISMILNVILIVVFKMGIESFYISFIIGVLAQIILIEFKKSFLRQFSFKNVTGKLSSYLKFSVPVTVSAISNWLLNGLTQVFIASQLGSYYNGLYGVANKFSSILILGVGVFQFAWNEMAYDLSQEKDRRIYYKKSISEILRFSIVGVSLLIILVKIIYPFMVDSQYKESLIIVPILLVGTMANSFAGFLGTLYLAERKSGGLLYTTLMAGFVNAILSFIMIPIYGFLGAVSSLCIALALFAVIRVISIKKQMDVVPFGYSILPMILLAISIISFYLIDSSLILLFVLIVLCVLSLFFLKDLLSLMINLVRKRKKS